MSSASSLDAVAGFDVARDAVAGVEVAGDAAVAEKAAVGILDAGLDEEPVGESINSSAWQPRVKRSTRNFGSRSSRSSFTNCVKAAHRLSSPDP